MDDPRTKAGFIPAFFPRCDGAEPPEPEAADHVALRKLDFLAVYYHINLCSRRVRAARQGSDPAAVRSALQAMEKALLARDAVEDQHAPYGIAACPRIENGLITEIRFSAPSRPPVQSSSVSMRFAVPPPDYVRKQMDLA